MLEVFCCIPMHLVDLTAALSVDRASASLSFRAIRLSFSYRSLVSMANQSNDADSSEMLISPNFNAEDADLLLISKE